MSYTIAKVLPTTKKVKLINKSVFVAIAKNEDFETFVIYVITVEVELLILIHLTKKA